MKRALVFLGIVAVLGQARTLPAQGIKLERVSAPVLYESYSFDPGIAFSKLTELTIPVGIDIALGRFGSLTLSTGFAKIDLTSALPNDLADQSVSGLLDSEIRLGVNVVPGKLVAFATGAIPTGIKTLDSVPELSILGAISSDIIGFAAPTIGSGGSVGAGFAGAVPVGRFALGLGANYTVPFSYVPVIGDQELSRGGEFRVRGGLEGPLSRQTYVRIAGVFATRSKDEVGSQVQNGVGNRLIGYVALSQGLGRTQLSLYGFDVYRGSPLTEETAQGLAVLPKGNLIAFGTRWMLPLGRNTVVTPRFEYRYSSAAQDLTNLTCQNQGLVPGSAAFDQCLSNRVFSSLEKQGNSLRFGFDFQQTLSPNFTIVLQGSGVTGSVVQDGDVSFSGYRGAVHLQVRP